MDNRFFHDEILTILLRPDRWSIVSSLFPPTVQPIRHPEHLCWMQTHSHQHAQVEIMLPLRGAGIQGFHGQTYPAKPGMVFVFSPFDMHDFYFPDWAQPIEQLWIHLMPGLIIYRSLSFSQPGRNPQSVLCHQLAYSETKTAIGESTFMTDPSHALPPAVLHMRVHAAVTFLVAAILQAGYVSRADSDGDMAEQVIPVVQRIIRERAGQGLHLDSLAEIAGYSKYHFHRLFKRSAGMTVQRYIDECRFAKAQELLHHRLSKKEVAAQLAFSSPAAFSRWYNRMCARQRDISA